MASDGVVLIFWIPMLICLVTLTIAHFQINKVTAAPNHFASLGGRRIVLGLSGAMRK